MIILVNYREKEQGNVLNVKEHYDLSSYLFDVSLKV